MQNRGLQEMPEGIAAGGDASPGPPAGSASDESMYSVERITSLEDFQQLRTDWNALLHEETLQKPFREHEYFDLWLRCSGAKDELSIFLVKRQDRIEAIFPFALKRERYKGLSVRQLEFIGTIGSGMRTPLFRSDAPTVRETTLRVLFRFLAKSVRWDLLRLNFLPEKDFDLETLRRILTAEGLQHKERSWFGTWYLDGIDVTGEEYVASRVSHVQKNVKRFAKRFGQDGAMEIEILTNGDDDAVARGVDHFHAVYKKSWKEWEAQPVFDLALAKMARDKGYLRLGLLFVRNDPVAAQFWLVCNRKAYIWKVVHDEQFKKFSPGVTLTAAMSTHVIDNDNVNEINFGFGDDSYKKDWTPKRLERKNILTFNRHCLRGWLVGYVMPKVGYVMRANWLLNGVRRVILRR